MKLEIATVEGTKQTLRNSASRFLPREVWVITVRPEVVYDEFNGFFCATRVKGRSLANW